MFTRNLNASSILSKTEHLLSDNLEIIATIDTGTLDDALARDHLWDSVAEMFMGLCES